VEALKMTELPRWGEWLERGYHNASGSYPCLWWRKTSFMIPAKHYDVSILPGAAVVGGINTFEIMLVTLYMRNQ